MRKQLVALLIVAIFVPVATAAKAPSRVTLTGTISVLRTSSVTVKNQGTLTCRVAHVSPVSLGYVIGSGARITCVKGVLTKIVGTTTPLPMIKSGTTKPSVQPSNATTAITNTTSGSGTVTTLSQTTITIGDATCAINPAVYAALTRAGIAVGDSASMTCLSYQDGSAGYRISFSNGTGSGLGDNNVSITTGSLTLGTNSPGS